MSVFKQSLNEFVQKSKLSLKWYKKNLLLNLVLSLVYSSLIIDVVLYKRNKSLK